MQFIDFEQLSSQIITHTDGVLNLRSLNLYDSHIIELLPAFSRLRKNATIDLSYNKITNFGAMLLIAQLTTARELMLENNILSDTFLNELSQCVWTHNMEISVSFRGEDAARIIQLTDYSKKSPSDFKMLNQHFSDHLEAIYQNPEIAKTMMVNFLLHCVKYWRRDYIQDQSYNQIVERKLLPGDYSTNKRQANIFNILLTAVNYASEVERLINVYKGFIKSGEIQAENLLLKETFNLITAIDDCELVEHEYYNSYDFICDIFDYFVKRYNDEIDNSLLFGTSPAWRDFIKNLRQFFSTHIVVTQTAANAESEIDIQAWEKVKSRSIFTIHRDKCSRLLAYFSGYLGGRTQTLIDIDNSIASLRNGGPVRVNPLEASIENVRNIKQSKLRFFKAQPADAFTQLLSAIRIHDRDRVALLLTNPILAEEVDTDFWSPIHHWAATSLVDREILTLLIAAKPDIIHDIIRTTGWNAVFVIINNSGGDYNVKVQKLDLLLQYGIDFCLKDELAGKLPIHYAVMSDEERIIEFLYKLKPETLQITDNNNKTPRDYAPAGSVAETLLSYYHAPKGDEVITEWRVMI